MRFIVIFSKIIGNFLSFQGFIILIFLALSLLFFKRKNKRLSIIFFSLTFLTYLFSTNFTVYYLSKALLIKNTQDNGNYIVILGGGIDIYDGEVEIGKHTLRRLLKGFELYKKNPRKIVVTGGSIVEDIPEAVIMKDVLVSFGVKEDDIIVEPLARNTYENAKFTYEITKDVPVTIVTSYLHMKRSKMTFEKFYNKVSVVNSDLPIDYRRSYLDFLPSYQAAYTLSQILHELFGIIQYRLR